jgi:hypothetical protein
MLLPVIIEGLFEVVPQIIGWAVLKAVTLGRYRGFRSNTLLLEGAVGFAAVAAGCAVIYWFW